MQMVRDQARSLRALTRVGCRVSNTVTIAVVTAVVILAIGAAVATWLLCDLLLFFCYILSVSACLLCVQVCQVGYGQVEACRASQAAERTVP